MAPPCVVVGLVANQYGVVRAMRFNRTRFFWAPSFVVVSASIVDVPSVCTDFMECYLMIAPIDLVYYDCY
jgi:hypothetical protein